MIETTPTHPLARPARWRSLVLLCAGLVLLLGLVVLTGWHTHLVSLIQIAPGLAPMQYNTAVCFILSALALGAWCRGYAPALVWIGGAAVALLGSLTLGEYVFHTSFGIDQLLFHSANVVPPQPHSHVGRMSPLSALCFCALGSAWLLLASGGKRGRISCAGGLAAFVISLGAIAIVGYIFGLPGTYGWGQMARVALHTAGGFVVLGTGLFLAAWHSTGQPSERTPRWLPAALALASTTATLVLYFALDAKQNIQIANAVHTAAQSARDQIAVRMEARLRSVIRMAGRWEHAGRPDRATWEADATSHLRDFPDVQAIEWIDTAHDIQWIVPLAENEAKLGLNLVTEERRAAAVAKAERERRPSITRTVPLFHGGLGYVVYVPLTVAGKPDGVLGTVYEAEPLFSRYLPPAVATGQAIRVSEGGLTVFERDAGTPSPRAEWIVQEPLEVHGAVWQLRMWPTPALLTQIDDPLPEIVLIAGLFGGLLLSAVCYLAQRASRLALLAARARDAMQRALEEVKTLKGLLPICAYCKRIRDDTGYWSQVDTYLHRHTDAEFSHGYCPECAAKAFVEFGLEVPEQVKEELARHNFE